MRRFEVFAVSVFFLIKSVNSKPLAVVEEGIIEADDPVYLVSHNHAALAAVHVTNQIKSVRVGKDIFSMEVRDGRRM